MGQTCGLHAKMSRYLPPFFKQKKGVIINLKGAPKKERKDLGVNMELYLVWVVPLSVQYVNNMAITRRHVDRRLCYFRTFIFFHLFFSKDIFVICFFINFSVHYFRTPLLQLYLLVHHLLYLILSLVDPLL